jgi:SAM-dependent methyltransferase
MMTEPAAAGPNAAQITYWNAGAGPAWVAAQDALDAQLRPLGLKAMAALAPTAGERLIDVGCGCGDTSLELARRVGEGGALLGADISAPMLAVARRRAEAAGLGWAQFTQADAQVHAFEPADGVFSRFGVMFFQDPTAAFANLRRALRPGGRVAFVCWRALAENPWMTIPMAGVAPLLPEAPPAAAPGAPGPFAFADHDRLAGILRGAGFTDIAIDAQTQPIGQGDLETASRMALSVGPVAMAVRTYPDLRDRIQEAVRAALAPHDTAEGVRMDSSVWIVRAA